MAYKKNDIIRFMTNQPGVHALEMFGHCEFNPDEIEKEEYIGRIKSVVANGASYVVSTISPRSSSICIADAEEVLGQLQEVFVPRRARVSDYSYLRHFFLLSILCVLCVA